MSKWIDQLAAKSEAAAGTALTLRAAQSGVSKKLTIAAALVAFLQGGSALTLSGQALSGSQANALLDLATTWNTTGAPTALKLNVTDTASDAASKLLDLQVGGVSKFSVAKSGLVVSTSAIRAIDFNITNANGQVAWNYDTVLIRDGAANTLALRNGANAQTFRTYNTYTDASNFERAYFNWSSNVFTIGTEAAGTGTLRSLVLNGSKVNIRVSGAAVWSFGIGGHLLAEADNTYDIGASGATRPRNVFVAGYVEAQGRLRTASSLEFTAGKSLINSPSNGVIGLLNNSATDFDRLQFGGTSASFPALKRSAAQLHARLADDSGFAELLFKLPTSDPGVSGVLWNNGGSVAISA